MDSKLIPHDRITDVRSSNQDKTIVFTNGCFDIIHRGHVEYLEEARKLGDILWVGLNSDDSVRRLKGVNRPINSELDRAIVLSALESIDYVTIFPEDTPLQLIEYIRPQIHTKGGDYNPESLPETPLVESLGGRVIILPFVDGRSTTGILKKLENPNAG